MRKKHEWSVRTRDGVQHHQPLGTQFKPQRGGSLVHKEHLVEAETFDNIKCRGRCDSAGTLHSWSRVTMLQPLWKTGSFFGQFLLKQAYAHERKAYVYQNTYSGLFLVAYSQSPPTETVHMSVNKVTDKKKPWYIHDMTQLLYLQQLKKKRKYQ